jgi:hypothetical protein
MIVPGKVAPTSTPVGPETTESVRKAAWLIVDELKYSQLNWPQLVIRVVDKVALSESTMRRASRALRIAGVIAFDREVGMWSRVEDVEVPASLWPRHILLKEQERDRAGLLKGLRLVHDEYLKAKAGNPDDWSAPAFARAMQLVCESVGLPLDRAAWGEPS